MSVLDPIISRIQLTLSQGEFSVQWMYGCYLLRLSLKTYGGFRHMGRHIQIEEDSHEIQ